MFGKTVFSYPLIRIWTCSYQGVRNSNFRKFCVRPKWIIPNVLPLIILCSLRQSLPCFFPSKYKFLMCSEMLGVFSRNIYIYINIFVTAEASALA